MKQQLTSLIAAGLKYVIGVTVAGLVAHGFLTADDAKQLDAETVTVVTTASGFLATILTGIAQALLAKHFPALAGLGKNGASGTMALLAATAPGMAAGLMGFSLLSCSTPVPLRIGIARPEGAVSYSSKGGLEVVYRKRMSAAGKELNRGGAKVAEGRGGRVSTADGVRVISAK